MKLTAMSRRTLGLIAVAIPIFVLFIYVVIRSGPMAPVSVTTASVTMRELKPQIAGIGTVEARYAHRVGPITPGRLLRVDVQPGDTVEAGQMLAELDPVDLEQRLDALRAAADRAEATLYELEARHAFAASQAERYEKLFTARVVSEEQVITKRQELRIAESALNAGYKEIARTRADVRAAGSQRDSLILRAPVDGIVAARSADPGTTVVAGQSVVEIIEPAEVWLNARFDQVSAYGLAAGLPATIELRSREGELFEGEVARVEPKADPVTEETVAKIAFVEKVEPLPPLGEIVHLTVRLPVRKAAFAIPSAALRRVDHAIGVWKVADGEIGFTPVRTGPTDLHGYVQVLDGLREGDVIVLYSEATLTARTRIREVEALPGAAP